MTEEHKEPAGGAVAPISAQLSVWDAVSIIIGIVVGVSIFRAPPIIFSNVATVWQGMLLWAFGGVLSLFGALCYAELATTYPRSGGDYVYLRRAYGPWAGFLFGWAQLAVILTGSTGALAYVFADYAVELAGLVAGNAVWIAAGAVVFLTVVNLCGVVVGKSAQNVLTFGKLLGLLGIVLVGLSQAGSQPLTTDEPVGGPGMGLAMILILYAYGGWNDAAFVAAELRERERNIPRALLAGTGIVMVIYLLINAAYLLGLGFEGLRASRTPAADILQGPLGDWAARGMSVLVMVSALGSVNGLIFTGSRVYATLGADHRIFAWLGRWHGRLGCPVGALASQAVVSLLLILLVGTKTARDGIDRVLVLAGGQPLPWDKYGGGFDTLVAGTAPVFWLFFLLTGLSLFVLRFRDPGIDRPFRVPLFPVVPVSFCLMCGYMLYSSVEYARALSLLGILPLLLGLLLYLLDQRASRG